ncbi:thiolase family protein [Actinoalloteichus hymeniacidonis]|uniref:Probable acetyl-CoA acetyltransferase n=1 Tax=Actinoalloteichus hymeniacidonis TaxID=340345 RepID=A0AAC9HKY2_9PSEU|nr:thiolase family protein [Actinoalloteichus hymeniacidonis]AOS61008.1 acetyl-CoA acetyltransferase [Actinoalloteichus hymeniacidonis]MBB5910992.1 acetyl-CoA acetyltransferase family protein [Actinoalloteichus hymeniacidonis]
MRSALILDAARTPFGRYRGGLSGVRVDDLAALPIVELLRRHGPDGTERLDPTRIDDIVYGNTNGAGEENRNVARMAALLAGLPPTIPGVTVNRLCGSGGESIVAASRAIATGDADLMLAGGVEGMSRAPFVVPRPARALPDRLETATTTLGWRLVNPRMPAEWTVPLGTAAEQVAIRQGISREAMDHFALLSHRRAVAAWDAGVHDGFAFAVRTPDDETVRRDESVRADTNEAQLAGLGSVFSEDGPVTAGNSAPLNDGAVAALIGTEDTADRLGLAPIGRIVSSTVAAVSPEEFSLAPVPAVRKLLARLGIGIEDVALWEINEAFAAMVLSVLDGLPEIDPSLVNVHGGALAYGHPLGASMSRVVVDLCRHLRVRGGGLGIATACVGVGQGIAIAVEA